MIAGLQRTYGMQLAAPAKGAVSLGDLTGGSLLVQGRPGDDVPLLAALTAAGVDPSSVEIAFLKIRRSHLIHTVSLTAPTLLLR